jgi:hypothetical protein
MLKLLFVIAGAYLLLVAFVYVTQASMLYLPKMPGRELVAAPDAVGLDFEDITLQTSDGVSVHGWFVPGDSPRVLLYFHGNAGNISHRLYSIKDFHGSSSTTAATARAVASRRSEVCTAMVKRRGNT